MFRKKEKSPKEQRKQQLRRKKWLNILRNILVILIILSVLAGLIYSFVSALMLGVFDIKTIEVEGASTIPDQVIIDQSGIEIGENIFLVRPNEVRANIDQAIITKRLNIQKVFPDKIVITVEEKPVEFCLEKDKKIYYFGRDAQLIASSDYLNKTDVPIISGLKDYQIGSLGSKLKAEPDYKFDTILSIIQILDDNGLLNQISEVSLLEENTYRIITHRDTAIIVKDLENFKEYYGYIEKLILDQATKQTVNLTSGNHPIVSSR